MVARGQTGYEFRNIMMSTSSGTVGSDYMSGIAADVHTHPYKYDFEDSTAFSGTDVVAPYLDASRYSLFKQGYVRIVRAGRSWYTLEIEDQTKAWAMYQALEAAGKARNMTIRDHANDIYTHTNVGTDITNIRENCVIKLIGQAAVGGVGFYKIDSRTFAVSKLN